jgi:PhzF family phenazine biosynthesis protein
MYQIDAFAERPFEGNPAAVCLLSTWLPDPVLVAIAAENNLSETAFVLTDAEPMQLRWFTPREEVPLCGHATLAAGYVVLEFVDTEQSRTEFQTRSGSVAVSRGQDQFELAFPRLRPKGIEPVPAKFQKAIGEEILELLVQHDDPNYFAILRDEDAVRRLLPDLRAVEEFHPYGLAVSAPGDEVDFVSRYFAPGYGIPEDPVTGSIHCALGPYWSARIGRSELRAVQLSERGGRLGLRIEENQVLLTGQAALYLQGEIRLPSVLGVVPQRTSKSKEPSAVTASPDAPLVENRK